MVVGAVDKDVAEIRKLLKSKSLIIGSERTLKNLKLGKVSKVYVSSNCSEKTEGAIEHYSKLSNTNVVKLKYPNDELGTVCKKPFSISVLSAMK